MGKNRKYFDNPIILSVEDITSLQKTIEDLKNPLTTIQP